jgi:hypothetical protein
MRLACVGVVILAGATLALAADGLLDPGAAIRPPEVGEHHDVRFRERLGQSLERAMGGAPARTLSTDEQVSAAWREEVLEVAEGRVVAARVAFSRWRRKAAGADEDASLEGRTAVVRARTDPPYTLEPPEPAVSPAAARFLGRVADGLGADLLDRALVPPAPTAAGASWTAGEAAAGLAPGAPFTEVVAARSSVQGTVTRADATGLGVRLEGALQLRQAPGTRDRFTEGGAYRLTVEATWRPGERPGRGTVDERGEVEGTTRGQTPDGTPYTTKVRLKLERHRSVD